MADVTRLVTVYKVATANIRDVLFEGEVGNFNSISKGLKIPLSNSYKNYDILGFYLKQRWNTGVRFIYREIPTEILDEFINGNYIGAVSFCWGFSTSEDYFDIEILSTDTELDVNVNNSLCTKIVGIKYVTVGTLIDNKG